jgi:ABC-2 type transport system ATP-binding protein
VVEVIGLTSEDIGRRAAVAEIVLFELVPHQISLEETFMEMTRDAVEYHTQSHDYLYPP